jgi:hypothetical protein
MHDFGQDDNLLSSVWGEMCVNFHGNFEMAVEGFRCSHISPNQSVNQNCTLNIFIRGDIQANTLWVNVIEPGNLS